LATPSDTDRALREKLRHRGRPKPEERTPTTGLKIGKYLIGRKLGSGGMGDVYLATDPDLGREVAVKLINLPLTDPAAKLTAIRRFRVEARAAAKVTHPNVVTVYEFSEMAGKHLLVMEYLRGRTFRELIDGDKALPPEQVVRLAIEILQGLEAIHAAGMIHRDLKPQNLMLTPDGHVKILDFGLVKDTMQSNELTQAGMLAGSPYYMAPEQTGLVAGKIDKRSDLYALGIVLFQLLTGQPPFTGNPAMEIQQQTMEILQKQCNAPLPPIVSPHGPVPLGLADLVRKATSKNPESRYATASEMRLALVRLQGVMRAGLTKKVSDTPKKLPPPKATTLPVLPRTITPNSGRHRLTFSQLIATTTVKPRPTPPPPQRPRSPSVPPPIPAAAKRPRVPSVPPPIPVETPALAKTPKLSWLWTVLMFTTAIGCAVFTWMYVTGRTPWNAGPRDTQEERAGVALATSVSPDAAVAPLVAHTADEGCEAYEKLKLGLAIEILKPLDAEHLDAEHLYCLCAAEHSLGHADEWADCQLFLRHPKRDENKARQVDLWFNAKFQNR
jgi:serine/threonine protein kinase